MVTKPTNIISLVEYIQLLHKGKLDKSLFEYFEYELRNSSPLEINIAIENLLTRYHNMDEIEGTVSRFIRSTALALEKNPLPEYSKNSIFYILSYENKIIKGILANLKQIYISVLPDLKINDYNTKMSFRDEILNLEVIKSTKGFCVAKI